MLRPNISDGPVLRISRRLLRRPVPLPVPKNRGEVGYLSLYAPAAVCMHGGDRPEVSAVLTEPAEVEGVQEPDSEPQRPEDALPHQVEQDILLLHSRGVVLPGVPRLEQRDGPVVRPDEVEARVDVVCLRPRVAIEMICANLEIFRFVLAQSGEWVPQPHNVCILFRGGNNMQVNVQRLVLAEHFTSSVSWPKSLDTPSSSLE